MLKPIVVIFAVFACLMVYHFSVNKEDMPTMRSKKGLDYNRGILLVDYAKGWKVRRPSDIRAEGDDDDNDPVLLKMTTVNFRPTDRESVKFSPLFILVFFFFKTPLLIHKKYEEELY